MAPRKSNTMTFLGHVSLVCALAPQAKMIPESLGSDLPDCINNQSPKAHLHRICYGKARCLSNNALSVSWSITPNQMD